MESYNKALSRFVSVLLDEVGYSDDMVQKRRRYYKLFGKLLTGDCVTEKTVLAGSKGEGISRYFESDIDMLVIDSDIQCFERGYESHPGRSNGPWILTLDRDQCSPGYTRLLLSKCGSVNYVRNLIIPDPLGENLCMSSKLYMNSFEEGARRPYPSDNPFETPVVAPQEGPAVPTGTDEVMKVDNVNTFPCLCPSILHEWLVRRRPHNWPSWELRLEVLRLGATVCPVGCKRDVLHDIEWRFCFNLGEIRLVESLNETQTKLYILLKMILKDHLKPENKEITSYTMKSVVFWLCEQHPRNKFTSDSLTHWLVKALRMLRLSVKINFLPYYMIPGRNLLKPLTAESKQTLMGRISRLVEDPLLVFQCRMLGFAMKLNEMNLLTDWRREQDSLETLKLEGNRISYQLEWGDEVSTETLVAHIQRKHQLLEDEKAFIPKSMHNVASDCEVDDAIIPGSSHMK